MKYFTTCTTLDERNPGKHSKKQCWYARNTEQHLQALRAIETGLTA